MLGRRALAKRRADEMKMKADAAERAKQQEKMLAERREAAKMFEEYKVGERTSTQGAHKEGSEGGRRATC